MASTHNSEAPNSAREVEWRRYWRAHWWFTLATPVDWIYNIIVAWYDPFFGVEGDVGSRPAKEGIAAGLALRHLAGSARGVQADALAAVSARVMGRAPTAWGCLMPSEKTDFLWAPGRRARERGARVMLVPTRDVFVSTYRLSRRRRGVTVAARAGDDEWWFVIRAKDETRVRSLLSTSAG